MKITHRTKLSEVLPLLNEERLAQLLKRLPTHPLRKNLMECTVGEFCRILNGEEDFIQSKILGKTRNAVKYFCRLKELKRQMELISKYLSVNKIEYTDREKRAAFGVVFLAAPEQILLTVQKAFFLHSFREAEALPLSHYLMVARSLSADAKFNLNLQKEYERERKLKLKR